MTAGLRAGLTGVLALGPVRLALLLAALASPVVAWSLQARPPDSALFDPRFELPPVDWQPIDWPHAWLLTLVVVGIAALVGGAIGGRLWQWHRLAGVTAAVTSAWYAGIVVLPAAAAVLGISLRTGIICLFGCVATLRNEVPLGGPYAYWFFAAASTSVLERTLVSPLIVLTAAWLLTRSRWTWRVPWPSEIVRIAVWSALILAGHGAALILDDAQPTGATGPYLALAVGVVIWAIAMDLRDRRALGAQPVIGAASSSR